MNERTQIQTKTETPSFSPSSALAARTNLLQRKCACGGTPGVDGECAECRKRRLQRRASNHAKPETAPPIVHETLSAPGQPLDPAARAFMEPRLGHDFSRVRVHTDARAAESARAVNAAAYTVGRQIIFGAGQYAPETSRGRKLMAHELVHTIQQGTGSFSTHEGLRISNPRDESEQQAESVSRLESLSAGYSIQKDHRVVLARQDLDAGVPDEPRDKQYQCLAELLCVSGKGDYSIPGGPPQWDEVNEQCRVRTGYGSEEPNIELTEWECTDPEVLLQRALDEIDEVERKVQSGITAEHPDYDVTHQNQLKQKAWDLCIGIKSKDDCRKLPQIRFRDPELLAWGPAAGALSAAAIGAVVTLLLAGAWTAYVASPAYRRRVNNLGEELAEWPRASPEPIRIGPQVDPIIPPVEISEPTPTPEDREKLRGCQRLNPWAIPIRWPAPMWHFEAGIGDPGSESYEYDLPRSPLLVKLTSTLYDPTRPEIGRYRTRITNPPFNLSVPPGWPIHHKWPLYLEGPGDEELAEGEYDADGNILAAPNLVVMSPGAHASWHRYLADQPQGPHPGQGPSERTPLGTRFCVLDLI